jgi:hypothetical protein
MVKPTSNMAGFLFPMNVNEKSGDLMLLAYAEQL